MRRSMWAWGIIVVSLLAAFITTITVLNSTAYSAHAAVTRYLQALEEGRTEDAARMAGVDSDEVVPISLEAEAAVTDIRVDSGIAHDGVVTVRAQVSVGSQPTSVVVTLRPAGTIAGVFTQWAFSDPPISTVMVEAAGLGFARANGALVDISVPLAVLAPGGIVLESPSPWFDVPRSHTVLAPLDAAAVTLPATPTSDFHEAVTAAVATYLDSCATQAVMFPRSCPFGADTSYPISTNPAWSIRTYPEYTIALTDGVWRATGVGSARLVVTVVDIETGRKIPVTETIPFAVAAVIEAPDSSEPRIVVEYPAD